MLLRVGNRKKIAIQAHLYPILPEVLEDFLTNPMREERLELSRLAATGLESVASTNSATLPSCLVPADGIEPSQSR